MTQYDVTILEASVKLKETAAQIGKISRRRE